MTSPAASERFDQARALWRLADQANAEAGALRARATQLETEAKRLNSVAAAVSDGRPLEEALT